MKDGRITFDQYLEYRQRFAVSRDMAVRVLEWAEPLARQALGIHARRDQMDMGDKLHTIAIMTSAADNGGWGELMPAWFKPYERPLPVFILDNWAMLALLWQYWPGEVGPAYRIENLLKIFLGSNLLIPFLPGVQRGGRFLRHGAFTIFLSILWLEPEVRQEFIRFVTAGAHRFADAYRLRERAESAAASGQTLSDYMDQVEFEAFLVAEGNKIGGDKKIRAFLANETQFKTYAALFGGLCFSVATLYDWYGPEWETWIFQKVNLDYRLARFGLEAWASWLDVPL